MSIEINGTNGIFDTKTINSSEKYGRNAVRNHAEIVFKPAFDEIPNAPIIDYSPNADLDKNLELIEEYADKNDADIRNLPPIEYEYRYMPQGDFNKTALLAAASEEMGVDEISVEEFEDNILYDKDLQTAKPIDINNDGKITTAEYATTILAADELGDSQIDGVINGKGMDAVLEYSKKSNADAATKLYSEYYTKYNLGE